MKTSNESFVAFFSYVRRNDEHDRGRLTDLRKLLEAELWAQTGKELKIFQDIEDVQWGANWEEQITGTLDSSTILIVIVTPAYLESRPCRFEFEYFLRQESRLKQKLILPILYIDTPGLENTNDEIAVEISKHQWIDWRELRFVSLTTTKITKKVESLAIQIRDLILDESSNINIFTQESGFPPNTLSKTMTQEEIDQFESRIQSPSILPSLYIPIAQERGNKDYPPQQITIVLRSTDDKERDRRRIQTIYGTLISFHGRDRFSFQIFEEGKRHLIDFPNDTTRVCTEVLDRLKKLMGEESWRVEEITYL